MPWSRCNSSGWATSTGTRIRSRGARSLIGRLDCVIPGPRSRAGGAAENLRPVAQHHTCDTLSAKTPAEAVGAVARVGADAHLVEGPRAAAAQHRLQDDRVEAGEALAMAFFDIRVGREHLLAREAGAHLHAPRACHAPAHMLLQSLDEQAGPVAQQRHHVAAG